MASTRQRVLSDDTGIGMILVIGIMLFVTGLVAIGGTVVVNGLAQSRHRVNFESALAAAEAGIDLALGRIQQAYDLHRADYPIPSPTTPSVTSTLCNAAAIPLDESQLTDADTEQAWARDNLVAILASHPECVVDTPSGDVLIFKPVTPLVGGTYPRSGRVYAMGWSPDRATATSSRLVKAEYVFLPYKPSHAILTGKSLELQASVAVGGAHGTGSELAAVHTNGDLLVDAQGRSLVVSGQVSATGDIEGSSAGFNPDLNPGGVPVHQPEVPIPPVDAEDFYSSAPGQDPAAMASWYDLCANGDAKRYNAGGGPCGGDLLGNAADGEFRGWTFQSTTQGQDPAGWYAGPDTLSGTYFVDGADVYNSVGNATFTNLTVVARSSNHDDCDTKSYGNISWGHYSILSPAFHGLFFMADSDLYVHANLSTGNNVEGAVQSGMYVAGDQLHLFTSSSGMTGAAIAADQCTGPGADGTDMVDHNIVQGQIVNFDINGDSPFSSLIATTLWLEY